MVKCGVLFRARAELLNIIWTIFSFKGLRMKLIGMGGKDEYNSRRLINLKCCSQWLIKDCVYHGLTGDG
jgi:hypothetical protein